MVSLRIKSGDGDHALASDANDRINNDVAERFGARTRIPPLAQA